MGSHQDDHQGDHQGEHQGERERVTITKADVGVLEVHAVASMTAAGRMGGIPQNVSKQIEHAVQDAILVAIADGVSLSDAPEMHRRQKLARLLVLAEVGWISLDDYDRQVAELSVPSVPSDS